MTSLRQILALLNCDIYIEQESVKIGIFSFFFAVLQEILYE